MESLVKALPVRSTALLGASDRPGAILRVDLGDARDAIVVVRNGLDQALAVQAIGLFQVAEDGKGEELTLDLAGKTIAALAAGAVGMIRLNPNELIPSVSLTIQAAGVPSTGVVDAWLWLHRWIPPRAQDDPGARGGAHQVMRGGPHN